MEVIFDTIIFNGNEEDERLNYLCIKNEINGFEQIITGKKARECANKIYTLINDICVEEKA